MVLQKYGYKKTEKKIDNFLRPSQSLHIFILHRKNKIFNESRGAGSFGS
jgi:hypothetical protein